MQSTLTKRVNAIEAKFAEIFIEQDDPELAAFRAKAMERLDALVDGKARREYEALDSAGRISHWQGKIDEANALIASGGKKPDDELSRRACGMHFDIMKTIELKCATDNLRGTFPWHLMEARLDRLAELGYDGDKLKEWRTVHEPYRGREYQWRDACQKLDMREISDLLKLWVNRNRTRPIA